MPTALVEWLWGKLPFYKTHTSAVSAGGHVQLLFISWVNFALEQKKEKLCLVKLTCKMDLKSRHLLKFLFKKACPGIQSDTRVILSMKIFRVRPFPGTFCAKNIYPMSVINA